MTFSECHFASGQCFCRFSPTLHSSLVLLCSVEVRIVKRNFEFPEFIILTRIPKEFGNDPASPYHRCLNDCCFMD